MLSLVVDNSNPSLLMDWARCARPLPLVLARMMVNTPMGCTNRHALLGRLYLSLRPAEKLICQDEMRLCRLAKRGQLPAAVS